MIENIKNQLTIFCKHYSEQTNLDLDLIWSPEERCFKIFYYEH
jgi:hypothetical protein